VNRRSDAGKGDPVQPTITVRIKPVADPCAAGIAKPGGPSVTPNVNRAACAASLELNWQMGR